MEVTAEFLEGKIIYYNHPQFGRVPVRSGDGSIMRLEENIFRFTEYNLLPGKDGQLDGHFTFYVNTETFEYLIYKSACYGNLASTLPSDNINWVKNLIPREKEHIEAIIAYKLLGAYSWDSGELLVEGDGVYSYKRCQVRGLFHFERKSKKDMEAIKLLSNDNQSGL